MLHYRLLTIGETNMRKLFFLLLLLPSIVFAGPLNTGPINGSGGGGTGGVTANSCAAGSFSTGIAIDGTLTCSVPSYTAPFSASTITGATDGGSSIASTSIFLMTQGGNLRRGTIGELFGLYFTFGTPTDKQMLYYDVVTGKWKPTSTFNATLGDSAAQVVGSTAGHLGKWWVDLSASTTDAVQKHVVSPTVNRQVNWADGDVTIPAGTLVNTSGTGIVERFGATFNGTGAGGVIAVNQAVKTLIPYAVTTINQWTIQCDQDSGATGIIITPYLDAYAEDTTPTTTMCTTGTAPHTTDGAGAGGQDHQANWDCNITAIPANSAILFKVTTAPTAATNCTLTLKVTR